MPQSLVKNYIHIIFSTKHRQPLITQSLEEELFSYLVGICKNLECNCQNGYASFSVNPIQADRLIRYISTQADHHGKKSFKVEYRAFLEENDISYDERYVWD